MKKDGMAKTSLLNESISSAYQKSIPFMTTLELTQSCNLKCSHCYNFDRSGQMPSFIKENTMSTDEIMSAIDQIAELGGLYLNISGGEALLHPNLDDFVKRARNWNMEPRLKTNGLLLTEPKIKKLMQAGLRGIDLSLYGSTNETYHKFTSVKDGFSRTVRGIEAAVKEKLDTSVSIILHRYNAHEFEDMVKLCESYGLEYQTSIEVTDRYDGSTGARDFELTDDQFESLLLGKYGDKFMTNNTEKSVQCSCARSVCGINAMGDVYPCIGAPIKAGNLKDQKLADIWHNSEVLNKIRNLKQEDFEECMTCDYIESCSRSSGSCYINTGKYTGCDERVLAQAKITHKNKSKFNL